MRVKGFVHQDDLYDENNPKGTRRFVEEIPADAVRCEAVVETVQNKCTDPISMSRKYWVTYEVRVETPANLVGRKIKIIIIPEEA